MHSIPPRKAYSTVYCNVTTENAKNSADISDASMGEVSSEDQSDSFGSLDVSMVECMNGSYKAQEIRFFSLVELWEKDAPLGEDRSQVAIDVKKAFRENATELIISNASISTLPPLPRLVTNLKLNLCNKLTALSGNLSKLVQLEITRCVLLTTLPPNLTGLLKLSINFSKDFKALPNNLSGLGELNLNGCLNLKTLPENLTGLVIATIIDCPSLEALPNGLSGLVKLTLDFCIEIKTIPDNLSHLAELTLSRCWNLTALPDNLSRLIVLNLTSCDVTEWAGYLPLLERVTISNCTNFTTWSCSIPKLANLELHKCLRLKKIPDDLPVNLVISSDLPLGDQLFLPLVKRAQEAVKALLTQTKMQQDLIRPDVAQGYQQKYPLSCAAASLFFIGRELGIDNFPLLGEVLEKFPLLDGSYPIFDGKSHWQFFREEDVYMVSSGFKGNVSGLSKAGGSLPQNIVQAAKRLGLEAKLFVPVNEYTEALSADPTMPDVKCALAQEGITVNEHSAPLLNEGELEMKLLTYVDSSGKRILGKWDSTSHWVVSKSDGRLMDPGSGKNFENLTELNAYYKGIGKKNAVDTGMSFVLRNQPSLSSG